MSAREQFLSLAALERNNEAYGFAAKRALDEIDQLRSENETLRRWQQEACGHLEATLDEGVGEWDRHRLGDLLRRAGKGVR